MQDLNGEYLVMPITEVSAELDTEYTLPYGLMYANDPAPATKKFIEAVKKVK